MSYQEYRNPKLGAFFGLTDDWQTNRRRFEEYENLIQILWNRSDKVVSILVDDLHIELYPNQLLTTTFFHYVKLVDSDSKLTCFAFNREFYCVMTHDHEVSCYGILFFGTQDIPIITLDEIEQYKFDLLYKVFLDEFETRDNIQMEMLQMLLKRLIIKGTRLAKEQCIVKDLNNSQVEIIRQFNFLVDTNFREKKAVADYAALLNKSPKTLSNLFAEYNRKTPIQIIHERIVLEAKRLLYFSDLSAKEIAWKLGYEDPAQFSKLFKKVTGQSPTAFKKAGFHPTKV